MPGKPSARPRSGRLSVVVETDPARHRPDPLLSWWLAALLAGLVSVLAGWILVTGLAALTWLQTPQLDFSGVLLVGTRFWLLGYFAGGSLGGLTITVAPLGLTAILAAFNWAAAGFAGRQARLAQPAELSGRQRRALAGRVLAVFGGVQVVVVLATSFVVSSPSESARTLLGALLVCGLVPALALARTAQWHWSRELPRWSRQVPRAVGAAVLTMLVLGTAALTISLLTHRHQVDALQAGLEPGTGGGVLLVVLQLLWLPNLVLWATSWVLGAGFTLGSQTLVSPGILTVGMVPNVPVFGALPQTAGGPQFWWLASGLVAGAVAAMVVVRDVRPGRWDQAALVGGLSGVVAGLALTLIAWLSSGDLGTGAMAGVGVRTAMLVVFAPTSMGLAGTLTGAVWALVQILGQRRDRPSTTVDGPDGEPAVTPEGPDGESTLTPESQEPTRPNLRTRRPQAPSQEER